MIKADIYNLEERRRKEIAATMHIQIRSYKDRVARGTILFLQDKKEVPFCGLDQMCMIAEEYMDENGVFEEIAPYHNICPDAICRNWKEYQEEMKTMPVYGYPQKFAVRVITRGNQSLQGELRVGDKKCYFRSGMELMRLMHQWLQVKFESPVNQVDLLKRPRKYTC